MYFDYVIVGAGIAGAVMARRLAEEKDASILIVDKNSFVGGFCFDYRNQDGIIIHKYGPHIFRTDNEKVWSFLSRFTDWYDYQHKVKIYIGGKLYPMPINLDTVNSFLNENFTAETLSQYFERQKKKYDEITNVKEVVESQIGTLFYDNFFKNYTQKQWGVAPEELPPEIVSRIPIRSNRDDRYFTVKYQGIPVNGYTEMIKKILDHTNIKIMLNTEFEEIKSQITYSKLYYSGSIDEFYNFKLGKLPYRCVKFKFERYEKEWYQSAGVINYPNDYEYTRITEFKHFLPHHTHATVIAKEYPSWNGDSSYPIPTGQNRDLYHKYQALSKDDNIAFIGRLGEYQYYSMDQIVDKILNMSL